MFLSDDIFELEGRGENGWIDGMLKHGPNESGRAMMSISPASFSAIFDAMIPYMDDAHSIVAPSRESCCSSSSIFNSSGIELVMVAKIISRGRGIVNLRLDARQPIVREGL